MKYTLNIDEALLERVVGLTGAATKTEAIHLALREIDRKAQLLTALRAGVGGEEDEIRGLFEPEADPLALRVAETPTTYRTRRRPSS